MRKLSDAILNGVKGGSSACPVGINTNASITNGVTVVAREGAGGVTYVDLVNLMFAVDDALLDEGVLVMRSGTSGALKHIAAKDGSQGEPIMAGIYNSWGTPRPTGIQGMSIVKSPVAKTLGNRGDVLCCDFRQFALAVDGMNAAIERSDERYFDSGEIGFRLIMYAGGLTLG